MLKQCELAGIRIALENGDGIVPTVGSVDEFSAGMHLDFCGRAMFREIIRKGGNCGYGGQRTGGAVEAGGGDRIIEFVDDVCVLLVRRKSHVTGAGAGGGNQ